MPPPIEEKIRLGLFPHGGTSPNPVVAPPPNVTLDILYPPLADLILRCFTEGHSSPKMRPLPGEWEKLLMEAEKSLRTCANRHVYSGHLKNCPQCNAKPLPVNPIPTNLPSTMPAPATSPATTIRFRPGATTIPPFGTRICMDCGAFAPVHALYCPNCASAINPKACGTCGYMQVPDGAKCCPKCGKPV